MTTRISNRNGRVTYKGKKYIDEQNPSLGILLDGPSLTKSAAGLKVSDGMGGTPAGDDEEIQYNKEGAFGGDSKLRWDDVLGAVKIGDNPEVLPDNPLAIQKNVDSYFQVNIRNTNSGADASGDYIATADDGDDVQYYGDFGICNSGYDSEPWDMAEPHDTYLWGDGGNVVFGTMTPGKKLKFGVAQTIHEMHPEDLVGEMDLNGINLPAGKTYRSNGEDIHAHDFDRNSAGRISGGTVTKGTTGTVNIASGTGYLSDGTKYIKITWTDKNNVPITEIGYNYIAIDADGDEYITQIETTDKGYIRLGNCWFNAGVSDVTAIWNIPAIIGDYQKTVNTFFQDCLGTIVESGLEVTEQANPNELKLSIAFGALWVRSSRYSFSDITSIRLMWRYDDVKIASNLVLNIIDTTKWNNIANPISTALVTMTDSYWGKGLVFITTSGQVYFLYPEMEYATEDEAKNAVIPYADTLRGDDNAFLATIIYQKGDVSIADRIYDVRPYFPRAFGTEVLTAGGTVVDHGSLTGLSDDDHSQYHNDTRAGTWADTWLSGKDLDDIADSATYVKVTAAEKSTWDGKSDLALGDLSTDAYYGDRGKTAYDHSQATHAPTDAEKNVQVDWNEADSGLDTYIKNKPSIPAGVTAADTVSSETSYGASSSAGVATTFSRGDHTHGTPLSQLIGFSLITVSASAPGSPSVNDLWVDIS